MTAQELTTEMAAPAPAVAWNKRRLIWSVGLLLGAAALGALTHMLGEWASANLQDRLVFLGLSEWHWVTAGTFLCGAAAVAGFILLAGEVLNRIRHTWTRWIAKTIAFLLLLGAIGVWLLMLLMFVLMAAMSTHFKVESPGGSSVIVEQGGYDPDSYAIYTQKSSFVYTKAAYTEIDRDAAELQNCSLADGESELVLTCERHVVVVPLTQRK